MAETSSTDSPHPDELEYGSEPANEVEADSPRARGRKRRSADVNNGLVSPSISVEPKDPAQGKRARGEEAGGKRVRKANPIFADYIPTDKKTAHTLLGQEPTNGSGVGGKGRKEVLMTPAEARTKKLAKGYQYVAAEDAKPQADLSLASLPSKRERKKPVHADFVDEAVPVPVVPVKEPKPKKISVTISNPNTNPSLANGGGAVAVTGSGSGRRGRTSSGGAATTPEPALVDTEDKPAKRTRSEQSRQAKLDFTLTMLNDQLAAVTSSIRNKETVSLPPVEPEPSNSTLDSPQNDQDLGEAEEMAVTTQPVSTPTTPVAYPTTPGTRGRGSKKKSDNGNRADSASRPDSAGSGSASASRAKRAKPARPPSPPSPSATFSTSRPVRTRKVRTPSSIAGDVSNTRGLQKCQEMVRDLLKHPDAWPFAKPVDPVLLNIPDYFDIIKHPMDLGTIKTQLNNGHYDHIDGVADDIRLVFVNCRTYNKADSDIVIMARSVEDLFESRVEQLKSMGVGDLCEDDEDSPHVGRAKIEEKIEQLSSQLKVATEEIKRLKKDRPAASASPAPAATPKTKHQGRPRDDSRPMSFEEKRRLSVQINNLSSEKLGKIVQIIHESNPKLAQSSAPDVIEIDIDALDTSTLRHLERVVRQSQPRQRSTSSASASPAPNRLAQAELAASGTKERIADVKRQLDALNRSLGTKGKKNTKKGAEDEDVVIDDEAPSKNDSDSSSSDSSSSDSSSESDSSETSSDSDSESDQEATPKPPPPKLPTNVPAFPFPVNSAITPVAMPITTNPILPTYIHHPPSTLAPLPRTPPSHDGVIFSLDKTQAPVSASTEVEGDVPEIKPSTGTKKAPEAISWNTSVLEAPAATESPTTPPPAAAGATDMWSQFQNKNIMQKQKEKEREEQEEIMRKEREEREEERKREDEKRRKEMEEAEVRKQRDSEAEKEQKHKQMMEQRAKAKEERERMQGKNMSEQSDMMASFERENRGSLPNSAPFQLSSLDLQSLASTPASESSSSSSESTSESTTESTSQDTTSTPSDPLPSDPQSSTTPA